MISEEEKAILRPFYNDGLKYGSARMECVDRYTAVRWCAFLKTWLPPERDVAVIREREINIYTFSLNKHKHGDEDGTTRSTGHS